MMLLSEKIVFLAWKIIKFLYADYFNDKSKF